MPRCVRKTESAVGDQISRPAFTVIGAVTRTDAFEAIQRHADVARQGLGQGIHREKCKSVTFRRFTNVRCAEKFISREEQVDNAPVGAAMHGANELPVIGFYDQTRFLQQFARGCGKRVFSVNGVPGRQRPLAIQIAGVETALEQNLIVRPDHAIGGEVGALQLSSHHGAFVIEPNLWVG